MTDALKIEWFKYSVQHEDYPHKDEMNLHQSDGHHSNHSAGLSIAIHGGREGGATVNEKDVEAAVDRVRAECHHAPNFH